MPRWKLIPAAAVLALALMSPVLFSRWCGYSGGAARGPQNLQEVIRVAEGLGLYHRSDRLDGTIVERLVISDRPISYERANTLNNADPNRPAWEGTVTVTIPWRKFADFLQPGVTVVWGETFLQGDPTLIRLLTEAAGA
jgi:hypothetical protein